MGDSPPQSFSFLSRQSLRPFVQVGRTMSQKDAWPEFGFVPLVFEHCMSEAGVQVIKASEASVT